MRSPNNSVRVSRKQLLALALSALALVAGSAPPQATTRPGATREDVLWERVAALRATPPPTPTYDAWFDTAAARANARLDAVRLYLTLYPGGAQRDEAITIELDTLFEIGSLAGGRYEPLFARVRAYLVQPPSDAALHEAAYWDLLDRRLQRAAGATQPASAPALANDPVTVRDYVDYLDKYPRSRHVPRLSQLVFDDALARDDRETLRRLVARLNADFPQHLVTAALTAELRRIDALGQPLRLTLAALDGTTIDTQNLSGQVVLVVVWGGFDDDSHRILRAIEAFRREHADVRVIGVSVDDTPERARAAARDADLGWPLVHDGLGWGGEFVRTWGIRRLPWTFVIDRDGRLTASVGGPDWEPPARAAWSAPGTRPSGATPPAERPGPR